MVAITESWVKSSTRDFAGEFAIPGYHLFLKDRLVREGGGVMLYVKESIKVRNCNIASEHEVLGVDLEIGPGTVQTPWTTDREGQGLVQ